MDVQKNWNCIELNCIDSRKKVSALIEWLASPTPELEGPGSIPTRVKLYSVYSMDVMIIPPMTCMTLKETVKIMKVGRKTTIK